MYLSPLGIFHTILSVLTIVLMFAALFKDREISPRTTIGKIYLVGLIVTTLTGFPIFRTGGITPPHILGVITLVTLGVAMAAGQGRFGRVSAYVETISYSATVLFMMIPTFTETLTRVPVDAPIADHPEAPILLGINAVLIGLFLAGAYVQVRNLREADSRVLGHSGHGERTAAGRESRA